MKKVMTFIAVMLSLVTIAYSVFSIQYKSYDPREWRQTTESKDEEQSKTDEPSSTEEEQPKTDEEKPAEETHTEHGWDGGTVTTAATCVTDGVKTYTCTVCGETKTETIAATGHSWDNGTVTTAATCAADGVMTYTCTVCGETKTEAIKATGHTVVTIEYQAPTCLSIGWTAGTGCSVCHEILSGSEDILALGHTGSGNICSRCGQLKSGSGSGGSFIIQKDR